MWRTRSPRPTTASCPPCSPPTTSTRQGPGQRALTQLAQEHGADIASCVEDGTFRSAVEYTTRQARAAGVAGTPTVFVDGEELALDGEDKTFIEWAGAKIAG